MSARIGRCVWCEPGDIYIVRTHLGGNLYGVQFHTGDTVEESPYPIVPATLTGAIEPGAWPGHDDTLRGELVS